MNLNGRRKERIRGAPRIIGGFDTTATVICWQAYVVVDLPANGGQISCGGIIIGSRTILASASCLLDLDANPVVASSIFVTVGAMDSGAPTTNANDPTGCAQEYTVTRTITYPTFQYPTSDDDLALLILSEAIDLQGKPCACTICLPNRIPAVGETCVMSGYGNEIANSSAIGPRDPIPLKWVVQTILQQNTATSGSCAFFVDDSGASTNLTNFICSVGAVGQDQCVGDSGGPLTCYNPSSNRYYLGGIISFGSETCGTGDGGQSVKVFNYHSWIVANSPAGDVTIGDISGGSSTPSSTQPTTSPPTGVPCGVPLGGNTDPFGFAAQFSSTGKVATSVNAKRKVRRFSKKTNRIIGGTLATSPREICWQATMEATVGDEFYQFCGGVIIGSRTILTAGHCVHNEASVVFPAANVTVIIGAIEYPADSDPSGCVATFTVAKVIPHPQWNPENLDNDIAVLVLSEAITFTPSGCYCTACVTDRLPATGEKCEISGFGSTVTDNTPQPANIPLTWVAQAVKQQSTDGSCEILTDSNNVDTDLDDFICAGGVRGQDSCFGDSGGPFMCYNPTTRSHYVAGLTSFGDDPCASNIGSQYTKVANYLDFIRMNAPPGDVQIQLTSSTSPTTTTGSTSPAPSTSVAVTVPTLPITTTLSAGTSKTTYYGFNPTYPSYGMHTMGTMVSTSTSRYHDYAEYYPPNRPNLEGPVFPFNSLRFPYPYVG
ncbi:hypothetical protein RvY_15531-1 [Ramazzottius varieornatus]|uniref:Peptidase S1 domain-containing protein n=1 Tax=Ramazzottius varieornatus TaxID=947166 RepID=A0A1D1W381_RAMVA|nr:hypothetical protein RvY_15531-1 [Ramazzottius varieornatus]